VLLREDGGRALREERDVFERRVALLDAAAVHERSERRAQTRVDLLVYGGKVLRQVEEHLGRREHHRGVRVLEPLLEQVHDVEGLGRHGGRVPRDEPEHDDLRPLVELADAVEQVVDELLLHLGRAPLDLLERTDRARDHGRVAVVERLAHPPDEPALQHELRRKVVQLEAAHRGGLAHVGRWVDQPILHRLLQVLDDVRQPKRAERAEREAARDRVLVSAVLLQRVDCEERELGVGRGVVADVQVDHLLHHQVLGRRRHDHLGEEARDVDAERHVRDHALHDLAPLLGIALDGRVAQRGLELVHLALLVLDR